MKWTVTYNDENEYLLDGPRKEICTLHCSKKHAVLIGAAPELLSNLREAYGTLLYLAPETFDDAEHEATWKAKLTRMQAVMDKAEGRTA